jgi:hypothetical protein
MDLGLIIYSLVISLSAKGKDSWEQPTVNNTTACTAFAAYMQAISLFTHRFNDAAVPLLKLFVFKNDKTVCGKCAVEMA